MKKIFSILVLVLCCVLFASCDGNEKTPSGETTLSSGEHQHEWSELVCGSKQHCLTCGEEKGEIIEHRWSEPVCEQKQICLICGKAQAEKVEHEWSDPVCEQKQVCSKCNEKSQTVVSHTTDRGNCERCGKYYISKENQIIDENKRHEQALIDLEEHYSALYDSHYNNYVIYSSMVSHSESYINSQMSTLISTISKLQSDVFIASLDSSYQGQLKYNSLKKQLDEAQTEYNTLMQERSYYNQINSSYESMNAVQNQYDIAVEQENQLHKDNLIKINSNNIENNDNTNNNTQDAPSAPVICTHEFDDWTITIPATCTEVGCTERICKKCLLKEYQQLDKEPHTEVIDEAVAPTRTDTGLTEGSHCSVCNTVLIAQEIILIPLFTLTLISNDGQTYSKSFLYQEAFNWNAWLKRDGYTLGGLFYNDALTEELTIDTMPEKDITLYAWWEEEAKPCEFTYSCYDSLGYAVIRKYLGSEQSVVIPSYIGGLPVKEVSGYAFENCSNVERITIPVTVDEIGKSIFKGCSSLKEMNVPFIGKNNRSSNCLDENYILGYFFETEKLKSDIDAPDNWIYQGSTYNLYEYKIYSNIPPTLEKIIITNASYVPHSVMYNCVMIKELVLESKVSAIYQNAFYNCSSMKISIDSDDIVEVGNSAFYNTLITEAIIPSLVRIGENAFANCKELTTVTISSDISNIPIGVFSGCSNLVELNGKGKVCIPENVTKIGDAAFAGCSSIKAINGEIGQMVLYDGLLEIGNSAFTDLKFITEIVVPSSVTSIGLGAFGGCESLESITLPFVGHNYYTYSDAPLNNTGWSADWVNSIFGYIFGYENAYLNKDFGAQNVIYQGTGYTKADVYIDNKVYYNVSCYKGYKIPQTLKNVTITKAVTISANAFYNCEMIEKITFCQPDVEFLKNALYNCSAEIAYST